MQGIQFPQFGQIFNVEQIELTEVILMMSIERAKCELLFKKAPVGTTGKLGLISCHKKCPFKCALSTDKQDMRNIITQWLVRCPYLGLRQFGSTTVCTSLICKAIFAALFHYIYDSWKIIIAIVYVVPQ